MSTRIQLTLALLFVALATLFVPLHAAAQTTVFIDFEQAPRFADSTSRPFKIAHATFSGGLGGPIINEPANTTSVLWTSSSRRSPATTS